MISLILRTLPFNEEILSVTDIKVSLISSMDLTRLSIFIEPSWADFFIFELLLATSITLSFIFSKISPNLIRASVASLICCASFVELCATSANEFET